MWVGDSQCGAGAIQSRGRCNSATTSAVVLSVVVETEACNNDASRATACNADARIIRSGSQPEAGTVARKPFLGG